MSVKSLPFLLRLAIATLLAWWVSGCSRQNDLEGHLAEAKKHYQTHDYEKAKIEFMNVLQLDRTNAVARQHLAKILFVQGQAAQAFPLLVWAAHNAPADVEVHEDLAVIYANLPGDTNRTRLLDEIELLLEHSATNEMGVLLLADTARTPEQFSDLEQRLKGLRARAGDHAIFHVAEGTLAQRRGDTNVTEASFRSAITLEPSFAPARLAYGNFLMLQHRPDEAEVQFRAARDSSPPYSVAWERWAHFLLERGRLAEAKTVLDEINAKAPERISAWNTRAQIALSEQQFDEADRILTRALSLAPSNLESLRAIGQLRLAQNKPADAIRNLEKVADMAPRSAQVHYQLALAHLVNKDTTRAAGSLETAIQLEPDMVPAIVLLADLNIARGRADEAASALSRVVRAHPRVEQAQLALIRAERAAGRPADALNVAVKARKELPRSAPLALQLGMLLRQQKQPGPAREALEAATQLSTNSLPALEQLVGLDLEQKDYTTALSRVQTRIDREPPRPLFWLLKAEVLLAQNDSGGAEAALRKALEIDPTSENAVLALARLYVRGGRQKEALEEIHQILQRDPTNLRALILVGMLETERGDYARAREAYETALKKRPGSTLVLNNLAYVLAEHLHQPDAAHAMALKARQIAPEDPLIADTLGWIEYRRGQYADALRLLTEASDRLPENPEVLFHLGMTHYMLDQEQPARRAFQDALNTTGDFPSRALAQEHLSILDAGTGKAADPLPLLEARRKETPGDIMVLSRLAAAYEAAGDHAKAAGALEAGLAANPQSAPFMVRLAELEAGPLKNRAKAMELARSARNLAPDDPGIAYTLGRLAMDAGDPAWAYPLLQESHRRLPDRAEIGCELALAAYSQGRIDEAVQALQDVTSMPSADPAVIAGARDFLRLAALARDPSSSGAEDRVQAALEKEPDRLVALHASAALAAQNRRWTEARDAYEHILQRYPKFTPAVHALALLYTEPLRDDAKAFELGMKAREADPGDEELAAALGKVVCRRGDFRYATELLGEAVGHHSTDPSVYYHLGLAEAGLHQPAGARSAFDKALALDPKGPLAEDIRKRLKELGTE